MLFQWVTDSVKKLEAAAIIQRVLDVQIKTGITMTPIDDQDQLAQQIIDSTWSQLPELCSGHVAGRPHNLSLAAFALARWIEKVPPADPLHNRLRIALGTLLYGLTKPDSTCHFHRVDAFLIEMANQHFESVNHKPA